jgi:biopolymer transport protein ExbB
MGGVQDFWGGGDAVTHAVALLLLALSVGVWVLILWQGWVLRRVRRDLRSGSAAYWDAPGLTPARDRLASLDREQVLLPLVEAAFAQAPAGTLQGQAAAQAQCTRRLRDALHSVLGRLQFGQVYLASVGATAPFIGLLGTVWGIYHALLGLAGGGAMTIDRIAGPVGEALIMTAAGLAVAIPAVLAYNVYGKWLNGVEAELEGFALDLQHLAAEHAA